MKITLNYPARPAHPQRLSKQMPANPKAERPPRRCSIGISFPADLVISARWMDAADSAADIAFRSQT